MTDEILIQETIKARLSAMRNKDGRAAVEMLSSELVAFEIAGPLQVAAAQATDVAAAQAWLDSWEGPIETEVRDLAIHVSGEVAFCHSLNRLRGIRTGGNPIDFWMRSTLGLRKQEGGWMIVHAHTSVPFHADGSFRAALDLQP